MAAASKCGEAPGVTGRTKPNRWQKPCPAPAPRLTSAQAQTAISPVRAGAVLPVPAGYRHGKPMLPPDSA